VSPEIKKGRGIGFYSGGGREGDEGFRPQGREKENRRGSDPVDRGEKVLPEANAGG